MWWVLLFGAIAVLGLVVVAAYALWLWHKTTDLFSELDMLGVRAGELAELMGQIRLPEPSPSDAPASVPAPSGGTAPGA